MHVWNVVMERFVLLMVTELDACALLGALIDVFNVCAELMALHIRITVSWWEQPASLVTKHWKRGKMADVALNLLLNLFLPLPQLRGLLQVILFLLHLYWYAEKNNIRNIDNNAVQSGNSKGSLLRNRKGVQLLLFSLSTISQPST